jgi:hypothetical protein
MGLEDQFWIKMYLFESAFMSGTTPINGSVPFPELGSETKSCTHLTRIQKFDDYWSVNVLEEEW